MKLYFGRWKGTFDFVMFFAKREINLRENDEVLVKTYDGIWTATVIDHPLYLDQIPDTPVFHGYIGNQEKKIIEHNIDIEREAQEKVIDFFGERDIKLHITGAESNFNRTKLIIYYEKKEDLPDFDMYRADIEESLKVDIEFVPKIKTSCCLTFRFTQDFAYADCTKIYRKGQKVVVKAEDGLWIGTFLQSGCSHKDTKKRNEVRVLGVVDKALEKVIEKVRENEINAYESCRELVEQDKLKMNLLRAEFSLSERKVYFYYTAEGRVDFRNLVKQLAGTLKKRIEMRQIGIRDELRTFPTIGICGQKTCCSRFLHRFDPVVLKMAKLQNLDINTEKITGLCNRLLCCLRYEYHNYSDFVEKINTLPKRFMYKGDNKEKEEVEVVGFNPIKETVILKNRSNLRQNAPYEELKAYLTKDNVIDSRSPIDVPKDDNRKEK